MAALSNLGEVFTINEAIKILNLSKPGFYYHIQRLTAAGFVERVSRGNYRVITPGEETGIDAFVLASALVRNSAVGYWSALNYYGLTEQMPMKTFIQTPVRGNYRRLLDKYNIKTVILDKKKFFGFNDVLIRGRNVRITNAEKTIIDCLDKPKHCGGISEVAKAFGRGVDLNKTLEYGIRAGNGAALKRMGYISSVMGLDIEKDVLAALKVAKGYSLLDPTLPPEGRWDARWGLIINVPEDYIGEWS